MDGRALQDLLDRGLSAANVSGSGVAIVVGPDGILAEAARGGVTADSPMLLGSLSKAFTAVAILRLVEQGLVDLDEVVPMGLPGTNVRDCLRHTTGLRADGSLAGDRKFRYSNVNYNFLGELIERRTGMGYLEFVNQEVLQPIGVATHEAPVRSSVGVFGIPVPVAGTQLDSNGWITPASGGLCLTARDVAKFLQAYLNGTFDLSAQTVDRVSADGDPAVGEEGDYGFGWVVKQMPVTPPVPHTATPLVFHTGKLPSFTTMMALAPEHKIGVVILTNQGDFLVGTPLVEKVGECIVAWVLGELGVTTNGVALPATNDRRLKRAQLSVGYAFYLLVCWFLGKRLSPAAAIPLALVAPVTVRLLSRTPAPWIIRFAPDFSCVLAGGATLQVAQALWARRR
ncbi:MAG: serine hydrolase domain-containing protein [Corynebacterium sp.]|nr:serine hydrolase domain-containing protein [Corynebacterium sp.]